MAIGFSERFDFTPIIGWELYHVTLDKYHVMFWFQNGHALLNVADRFSYRSSDEELEYIYEIYGKEKYLNIDRILRTRITDMRIVSKDRLDLIFENGDVLSVYDNPNFRSWWFLGGSRNLPEGRTSYTLSIEDLEYDELTEKEINDRLT